MPPLVTSLVRTLVHSLAIGISVLEEPAVVIPANALLDGNGNPYLDENLNYILT